jgi:hypothetical protein
MKSTTATATTTSTTTTTKTPAVLEEANIRSSRLRRIDKRNGRKSLPRTLKRWVLPSSLPGLFLRLFQPRFALDRVLSKLFSNGFLFLYLNRKSFRTSCSNCTEVDETPSKEDEDAKTEEGVLLAGPISIKKEETVDSSKVREMEKKKSDRESGFKSKEKEEKKIEFANEKKEESEFESEKKTEKKERVEEREREREREKMMLKKDDLFDF